MTVKTARRGNGVLRVISQMRLKDHECLLACISSTELPAAESALS